jgi:hypothetical protein
MAKKIARKPVARGKWEVTLRNLRVLKLRVAKLERRVGDIEYFNKKVG